MTSTSKRSWTKASSFSSPPAQINFNPYDYKHVTRKLYRWALMMAFLCLFFANNIAWVFIYTKGNSSAQLEDSHHSGYQTNESVSAPAALLHWTSSHNRTQTTHRIMLEEDAIQVIMVMVGAESAEEGAMTIKSALMHSSRPLSFHLICTDDAVPIIQRKLGLFASPAYDLDISFYPISLDAIRARGARAGVGIKYSEGLGGLVKLFLHELVTTVDRAIYLETDLLFVVDPVLLWKSFSTFKPGQMIAFPTMGPKSDYSSVSTYVMLLNLDAMRDIRHPFMSSTLASRWSDNALSKKAFDKALSGDGMVPSRKRNRRMVKFDPMEPMWGEQGLFHVIWTHLPEYFVSLSGRWDVSRCRTGYGQQAGRGETSADDGMFDTEQDHFQTSLEKAPRDFEQLSPGILHLNCRSKFKENHEEDIWASMVAVITQYRWIWLNRGDGSAKITVNFINNVRFQDERTADDGVHRYS